MTREEAEKCIKSRMCNNCGVYLGGGKCSDNCKVIEAIKALKQQEPNTGHWIPLGNYDDWGNESTYKCSECGDIDTYPDNYCPNCGAKMSEILTIGSESKVQE